MTPAAVWLLLLAAEPGIQRLEWLAGCWTMQSGPMRIDEQWSRPAAGMMLGLSRTIKQDRTVFHEFMRIDIQDGKAVFTPRIGTTAAKVSFRSIRQSDTEIVFENLNHDFPQRVIYRKQGDGLFARVENAGRHEDFPMKRVPCSASE